MPRRFDDVRSESDTIRQNMNSKEKGKYGINRKHTCTHGVAGGEVRNKQSIANNQNTHVSSTWCVLEGRG